MSKNEDLSGLTTERRKTVDKLSQEDLRRIDQALLSNSSVQWSRIDRIVLTTMTVIPAASSTACKCDVFTKLLRNKTPTIADFVVRAQGQWPISTLSSCHHLLKA